MGNERLSYRIESNLATSEVAKRWTESSPKSKLNEINSRLNSTKSNEAKELKNLINKREYREFQKKIGITRNIDLDGKLGPRTFESFNAYLQKVEETTRETRSNTEQLHTLQNKVYQDYVHKPEYQQLTNTARIHKNTREYISDSTPLSEYEYNKMFSGKDQLAQGQVGNCFMVSSLMELANADYFDSLIKTSVTRVRFKDGIPGFNVRIPLGEANGRDILIKDYELETAKLRGNLGFKLLEIAYVKNRRKNDSDGNRYYPVSEHEYQSIKGGHIEEALSTFLGHKNIGFTNFGTFPIWNTGKNLAQASKQQKTEITNCLKNYNGKKGNKFIGLATAPSINGDRESFNVGGHTFWKNHAYALNSVEQDSNGNIRYINVKNPWNNPNKPGGSDSRLTLNEFFLTFSYMTAGKITKSMG